jgi:hypothetical protein
MGRHRAPGCDWNRPPRAAGEVPELPEAGGLFGHGINKPKEQLAAMWQNWQWFARWIWGEEVELPMDVEGHEGNGAPGL